MNPFSITHDNLDFLPGLFSSDDFNSVLISDYYVFHSHMAVMLKVFINDVKTYESISGIPADKLIFLNSHFKTALKYLYNLKDRLLVSLDDVNCNLETIIETGFACPVFDLYLKKRNKLLIKIDFYDFIRDVNTYI